jgi:hypothetical protein
MARTLSGRSVPCRSRMSTTYHLKDTEGDSKTITTIANKQTTISVPGSSESSMLVAGQAQLSAGMAATSREAWSTKITAIIIQTSSELDFSV